MGFLSNILSRRKSSEIFLTYANDYHTDGAGAQLYRIFGVYALTRMYGFNYHHTPMHKIDHQGIEILEGKPLDKEFALPFNKLCQIENDKILPHNIKTVTIPNPKMGFERALYRQWSRGPILVRIAHPHYILDRVPHAWGACKMVTPFQKRTRSKPLRIAIHVRRGDVHILDKDRLLPNSYYIRNAKFVKMILDELDIPHVIDIHSEAPRKDTTVNPEAPGVYDLARPVTIKAGVDNFEEFQELGEDVRYHINRPAIESFSEIANADIIVTSKSAFSYLAAILSPSALVLYFPFWHAPLEDWFTTDIGGNFDLARFKKACRLRMK
ncbi:hypothetical protein QE369_003040 [Agrobacterium larrymoorei]|uniref:Uncharacterized protein n=1 Tax=Agrobacterium larrymoorei TaxID=160699 RepID=A0AAJ2BFK0_9HYPH|nr:hypothetical protein [Agrobacterium larrymoorei]MDR6102843.1 hypothetical protein [Agrobacterium larrymoorei]